MPRWVFTVCQSPHLGVASLQRLIKLLVKLTAKTDQTRWMTMLSSFHWTLMSFCGFWERSGSVVECLIRDRGAVGSVSMRCVLEQDTLIIS